MLWHTRIKLYQILLNNYFGNIICYWYDVFVFTLLALHAFWWINEIYLFNKFVIFPSNLFKHIFNVNLLLKTLHHNHKVCTLEVLFQNEEVQTSMYSTRHTIIENITFFIQYHYGNKNVKYDGNMLIT